MDFASQLANLERTANAASRRRPRDDEHQSEQPYYRNPRPRHYGGSSSSSRGRGRAGGGARGRGGGERTIPLTAAMERFGYRLQQQSPPPPPAPSTDRSINNNNKIPHICLLAITIDDLPYEHIWRAWASSSSSDVDTNSSSAAAVPCYVSLVCHAKFPNRVQSEWLKQRLLLQPPRMGRGNQYDDPVFHSYQPEWGSVEITRAMHDCLSTAVKIGADNDEESSSSSKPPMIDDERFCTDRFVVVKPRVNPGSNNDEVKEEPLEKADTKEEAMEGVKKKKTSTVPPVDKFIFISETCLPVRTLSECVQALFPKQQQQQSPADEKEEDRIIIDPWDVSWVNARNRNSPGTPKNLYERDQFANIHRMVPGLHRWKADQWQVLSRKHALAILRIDAHMMARPADQLWNAFANINASDEMYFPTALAVLGILKEEEEECDSNNCGGRDGERISEVSGTSEQAKNSASRESKDAAIKKDTVLSSSSIVRRPVTYVDWSEGMRNPASFTAGRRDLIKVGKLARAQGCLFARKFALQSAAADGQVTGEISVKEWKEVIDTLLQAEKEGK